MAWEAINHAGGLKTKVLPVAKKREQRKKIEGRSPLAPMLKIRMRFHRNDQHFILHAFCVLLAMSVLTQLHKNS